MKLWHLSLIFTWSVFSIADKIVVSWWLITQRAFLENFINGFLNCWASGTFAVRFSTSGFVMSSTSPIDGYTYRSWKRKKVYQLQARSGLKKTSPAIIASECRNWIREGAREASVQNSLIFMIYLAATPHLYS